MQFVAVKRLLEAFVAGHNFDRRTLHVASTLRLALNVSTVRLAMAMHSLPRARSSKHLSRVIISLDSLVDIRIENGSGPGAT